MLYDIKNFESNVAGDSNWRWKAPELLVPDLEGAGAHFKPTHEGDIYAYGCLFLEVCLATLLYHIRL